MNRRTILSVVVACLPYHFSTCANDRISLESSPLSWQQDAELTDVFFHNENIGWAVGVQGVILRTTNGGHDWKEIGQVEVADEVQQDLSFQQKIQAMQSGLRTQSTGIADGRSGGAERYRCRFESVHFIDEKTGWVAGGYNVPYLNHSRGIVLKTSDGGLTWRRIKSVFTPRLKRIYFSDRSHGWAIGERGNMLDSSIFYTTDGGETWTQGPLGPPQGETRSVSFRHGDMTARGFVAICEQGKLVGDTGVRERTGDPQRMTDAVLRKIRMIDPQALWCVGDEGAVWRTQNAGASWQPLSDDPASAIHQQFRQFDFQAIGVSPSKVWLAGSPGTVIFSVDRTSGEILSHSTGTTTPINSLHFADELHGWCVGSFGTILVTRDGGQSWQTQRGHHRSLAILGLANDEACLPFEAIAQYAGEDDRLMGTAVLIGSASAVAGQAIERLGGMNLSMTIQDVQEGVSEDLRLERMVRMIRTLKPNVVLLEPGSHLSPVSNRREAGQMDSESLVRTAIAKAADRSAFTDQIAIARLEPWSVDRLAVASMGGTVTLDPQRMLLRTGCLLEDKIAISRALMNQPLFATDRKYYRVEALSTIPLTQQSDLLSGLASSGKLLPQRASDQRLRGSRSAIELANLKQRKLLEFSRFEARNENDFQVWYQQIDQWVAGLDPFVAGCSLAQLAEIYLEHGRTELAAKSLELLIARVPGHPLEAASMTWLIRYFGSDEFGRFEQKSRASHPSQAGRLVSGGEADRRGIHAASQAHTARQDGQTITVWTPMSDDTDSGEGENPIALVDSQEPTDLTEIQRAHYEFYSQRWRRAGYYFTQLGQLDPDLISHPQFQLIEAKLKRKLGNIPSAEATLRKLIQSDRAEAELKHVAQLEFEFGQKESGTSAESIGCMCVAPGARPVLDGNLDEPFWELAKEHGYHQRAVLNELANTPSSFSAPPKDALMFACDGEFLYIGLQCAKLPGQSYPASNDPRPRDPDLSFRDRVQFWMDIDSDFQSAYRFTVDYRGWGAEDLNGAHGWNPKWYIGQSQDEHVWRIEAAIPLEELTAAPIEAGKTGWLIRLDRISGEGGNRWQAVGEIAREPTVSAVTNRVAKKGLYQNLLALPTGFERFEFR